VGYCTVPTPTTEHQEVIYHHLLEFGLMPGRLRSLPKAGFSCSSHEKSAVEPEPEVRR
jgi:hypothetical protein